MMNQLLGEWRGGASMHEIETVSHQTEDHGMKMSEVTLLNSPEHKDIECADPIREQYAEQRCQQRLANLTQAAQANLQ